MHKTEPRQIHDGYCCPGGPKYHHRGDFHGQRARNAPEVRQIGEGKLVGGTSERPTLVVGSSATITSLRSRRLNLEFDLFEGALGWNDVMVEAQFGRIHSECQAEQLREMEDRNADVFLENACRVGLLAI